MAVRLIGIAHIYPVGDHEDREPERDERPHEPRPLPLGPVEAEGRRIAQHRQHLTWLIVGFVVVVVLGLIIDTVLIGFALFILIPIAVELFMIRRTRSRSKIPDYRRPEPAEIELEHDA